MKWSFLLVLFSILLLVSFFAYAERVNVKKGYHFLSQIAKDDGLVSIDANGNGIVDTADHCDFADKVFCDNTYKPIEECSFASRVGSSASEPAVSEQTYAYRICDGSDCSLENSLSVDVELHTLGDESYVSLNNVKIIDFKRRLYGVVGIVFGAVSLNNPSVKSKSSKPSLVVGSNDFLVYSNAGHCDRMSCKCDGVNIKIKLDSGKSFSSNSWLPDNWYKCTKGGNKYAWGLVNYNGQTGLMDAGFIGIHHNIVVERFSLVGSSANP